MARGRWTSHTPFGAADRRTAVTPQRAIIETVEGQVVDVLDNPRASFTGFGFEELPAWDENGERWHRVRVTYPHTIATHSRVQTFYVGADFRLRRHDYDVDINGGTPAVHYFSDYATVDGVNLPTRHLIYARNPDGGHSTDPLVVSIVVSGMHFG